MPDKHLHIVCFTVPYPVNYGGVFDVFYKLVALHRAGVAIHLHCYTEEGQTAPELNAYCTEIHYYRRRKGIRSFSFSVPYIVSSRTDKKLSERLLSDNFPILLEGIHCTWISNDDRFAKRNIFLRLLNVEYKYYYALYKSASSILKKIYYLHESRLLKRYEQKIARKPSMTIALSQYDMDVYQNEFGVRSVRYLPVFTGFTVLLSSHGLGKYCLYHGNLSVAENEKAALWLMNNVFNDLPVPLIIAGKDPSERLRKIVLARKGIRLVENPSRAEMQTLVNDAQCNVLPSFNTTGIKLKLINAFFNGRHCIINEAGVKGSGIEEFCHIADHPEAFKTMVQRLFSLPFTDTDISTRKKVAELVFNEEKNVRQLISWIW